MGNSLRNWLILASLTVSLPAYADDVKAPPATDKPAAVSTDAKNPTAAKPEAKAAKSTGGATAATKKAVKATAASILGEAVEKLTEEYREATKKGGTGTLRQSADYFTTVPPELTPDKVLAAIGKSYGSDPTMDAYVRWQLMSALPPTIDEKLASKGLAAYRSAPRPVARLGVAPAERRELDQAIRGKDVDVATINSKFIEAVNKRMALNAPIYAFRTDLFNRLPATPDTLVAGLSDAMDRIRAADVQGGNEQFRAVGQRTMLWAVSVENPRQKAIVIDAVERLRKEPGVEYASEVEDKGNQRRWKIETARPSKSELDGIVDSLKGAGFDAAPDPKSGNRKK